MGKHLAKEHNIGHAKGKNSRTAEDILVVKVQSFCTGDQYRPFVVRDNCSQLDGLESSHANSSLHAESESESSHAVAPAQDVIAKELDAMYASSQQQWLSTFERLQTSIDPHVDQTPPWLRSTGISRWMTDLQKDKKDLRGYCCSQKQSACSCQLIPLACNQILIEDLHADILLLAVYSLVDQAVNYPMHW